MPPTRPSGRVVALCVFAAAVASADAGGAVAWLQGGDVMRAEQNSTPRRHHHGGATSDELDDLRARIIPGSRAQVDMRDLADARDAMDRAAATETSASTDKETSHHKQRQQRVESAGGGVAFVAAPPAVDTEDIARRVRASKGEVVMLHGGLVDGGDSATHTSVLAGLGAATGAVFCRLKEEDGANTEMLASSAAAFSTTDNRAYFHGGYKVWDGGNDFTDVDSLSVFDGERSGWACAGDGCGAGLGTGSSESKSPGRRDEHVAVVTPEPVNLGGVKQRALVVFGGRDESDVRLDSVYALGLDDGKWRHVQTTPPKLKKGQRASQGPFDLPLVIQNTHQDGTPFPLARSGSSAVVSSSNIMYIFGGFVVEGRLGFNVGELLALDLNSMAFFYPKVTGDLPVRRNKHTAVVDEDNNMWVWGGSVWDHTGGSATYASTATHVADLSDSAHVVWRRVTTKGLPPSQRRLHTSVVKDGVMYVIGGEDYHSKLFLQDVHALDLKTLVWSQPSTAGSAGSGLIRAAAVGLQLSDPVKSLVECGEGTPVPALTGELQPKNDKLVTALEESAAAMGKGPNSELFAAAMGKKSGSGDESAIKAGWVPEQGRVSNQWDAASDLGAGLLVESRGMWELHLLANVAGEGLMEVEADDLPEFTGSLAAQVAREGVEGLVGADGWARKASRAGGRDAFKTETKKADVIEAKKTTEATKVTVAKETSPSKSHTTRTAPHVARQGRREANDAEVSKTRKETTKESKSRKRGNKRVSSQANEEDADYKSIADYEALDDFPRPEISGTRTRSSSKATLKTHILPDSKQAAADVAREVRRAKRVVARDSEAARVGGAVGTQDANTRWWQGADEHVDQRAYRPIDPSTIAASADSAYFETVEADKRELAAVAQTSRNAVRRDDEPGLGDVVVVGDEQDVDPTRADGEDLTDAEIVVDATTLGLGQGGDFEEDGVVDVSGGDSAADNEVEDVVSRDLPFPLASLGDSLAMDSNSDDVIVQRTGVWPEETAKLWSQFKAHLTKFETETDLESSQAASAQLGADDEAAAWEVFKSRFHEFSGDSAFVSDDDERMVRDDLNAPSDDDAHLAHVAHAAMAKTKTLVEASLGEKELLFPQSEAQFFQDSNTDSVLRVLGGAAVVATLGVFGMSRLITRIRWDTSAMLSSTSAERAKLVVPDPDGFRGATPLAQRESPHANTATWQQAAAKRWQTHFSNGFTEKDEFQGGVTEEVYL